MNRTRASKVNTTQWYNSSSLFLNRVAPSLVHDYAGQRYYNTTDGETSFPFTATRTTNAMQFDSQGRLIFAPANLLPNSSDSASPTWTVASSGTGVTPTLTPNFATSPIGDSTAVRAQIDAGAAGQSQVSFSLTSSTGVHTFSVWLRSLSGSTPITLFVGSATTNVTVTSDWQRFSMNGLNTATIDARVAKRDVWGTFGSADLLIWGPQVERAGPDTPKAYNATTGTAYYGPRFDYEPFTHEPLGLQVEDSRTNLVPISMGYDATTFAAALSALAATKSGSPVTYLGGWAAARYVPDGTNQGHGAFPHSITPSASVKISLQAIVAPISGGTFFQMTGSGAWLVDVNGYANFDLSGAGSITATGASAEAVFVRRLDTNVYHIGITVTTSAAPGAGATSIVAGLLTGTETRLQPVIGGPTFDYIYGAHFQGQVGHSSIVPSFGVTSTRAADVVNVNTGSWLNQTRGTMYADFVRGFVATGSGATQIPAALVEGATTYLAFTSGFGTHNTHRFDTVVAGANQAQLTTASGVTQFTTRKMIGSYTANDFKACENNGTVATDVSGTIPTAVTSLQIGSIVSGNFLNGWVKEFRYYADNSATGPQLQAATTLVLLLMASAALLASSDGFLFSVIA